MGGPMTILETIKMKLDRVHHIMLHRIDSR